MSKGFILWTTGFSGSGKTTLTERLAEVLKDEGHKVELLDGDVLRAMFKNNGFSKEERDEHIRRVGFLAHILARNDVIVLTATISPYRSIRDELKDKYSNFFEVFVDAPLEECIRRDVKGLYKKALAGEIKQFTGISDPYEAPLDPDLAVHTDKETLEESVENVLAFLKNKGLLSK